MFFSKIPPKILYKSKSEQDVLQKLNNFVDSHLGKPAEILARMWKDQAEALSYPEIREAIMNGNISEETMRDWIQDYASMAAKTFMPLWMAGAAAGGAAQPLTSGISGFSFEPKAKGVRRWVAEHSGEMITAVTKEQREAVRAMIGRAVDGKYTVDELSRVIRPCVGLNRPQATANLRYYETIRDNLLDKHPRMKVESAQKQAREMAVKYAERQHRQRAVMIAETELVSAFNQGNEQAVRQAQQQGKLGAVRRIGSTADDERVCKKCADRHGKEIPPEDGVPPWHPRCRCAIAYEPIDEPFSTAEKEMVNEPEFVPVDSAVSDQAYQMMQEEYGLIPPKHQDIIDKELVEIRRSIVGNSRYNKLTLCIEVADELVEGEFVHEVGHALEQFFGVFQDKRYLEILEESIVNSSGKLQILYDAETFVKPVYRVKSSKLVSDYQGRYYENVSFWKEDSTINPYAFSDFFAEGYREYVFQPERLKKINRELYDYIYELSAYE